MPPARVPIPQGTSSCQPSRGRPTPQPPGTHAAGEVSEQVLGHVVAVEQPKDDPLQVLLVDEAILVKICKRRQGLRGRRHQPGPTDSRQPLGGPAEPNCPRRVSNQDSGGPGPGLEGVGLRSDIALLVRCAAASPWDPAVSPGILLAQLPYAETAAKRHGFGPKPSENGIICWSEM